MKKTIIFLAIAIPLFACNSCVKISSGNKFNIVVSSIMVDGTDPLISLPDRTTIESQFNQLREDHAIGAVFDCAELSDVQYTVQTHIEIKPEQFLLSNPGDRDNAVDSFFTTANKAVTELTRRQESKPYSELYVPIAQEANHLMTIPGKSHSLVIYSNLYENSAFSIYKDSDLALLERNPEKVEDFFYQQLSLHNLSGLHVYFIYQPIDYADSKKFAEISKVYKDMFRQAFATVTIAATYNP